MGKITKKQIGIIIGIGFLAIFLGGIIYSNSVKYSYAELSKVVTNNSNDKDISKEVIKVMSSKNIDYIVSTIDMIFDKEINEDNRRVIINSLNLVTEDIDFKYKNLINSMINGINTNKLIKDDIIKFISTKTVDDGDIIVQSFSEVFKEFNNKNDISTQLIIGEILKSIQFDDGQNKESINSINKYCELLEEKSVIINTKDNLDKELKDIESKKQSKQKEIDNKSDEIAKAQSKYDEAVKVFNSIQPITINGFIIAEQGTKNTDFGVATQYEVAYVEDGLPTADRFLLYTYSKRFTTKGHFSLEVVYNGTQQVQLKEDYGSFTQDWKEYHEHSSGSKEILDETKKILDTAKSDLDNKKNNLEILKNELNALNELPTEIQAKIDLENAKMEEVNSKLSEVKL